MTAIKLASLLCLLCALSGAEAAPACSRTEPARVCTTLGVIRGSAAGDMLAYLGLPYAQPPLAKLRWNAPLPPAAWDGERDATHAGPRCPYLDGSSVKGDEDCLYLNLFRPRTQDSKPLPVMVWFHGGGNHTSSSLGTDNFGGLDYTGARLVPAGVILAASRCTIPVEVALAAVIYHETRFVGHG